VDVYWVRWRHGEGKQRLRQPSGGFAAWLPRPSPAVLRRRWRVSSAPGIPPPLRFTLSNLRRSYEGCSYLPKLRTSSSSHILKFVIHEPRSSPSAAAAFRPGGDVLLPQLKMPLLRAATLCKQPACILISVFSCREKDMRLQVYGGDSSDSQGQEEGGGLSGSEGGSDSGVDLNLSETSIVVDDDIDNLEVYAPPLTCKS